jgi:glycosyltransferase involved in cell wall biosynthesis
VSSDPIRFAFPLIGRGEWTGGLVYLRNTLQVIRSRLAPMVQASVFLSPEDNEKHGAGLAPLVDGRLLVNEAFGYSGRGRSLARALLTGRDMALERLLVDAGIHVVFEVGRYYGARFGLPVVAWLPDFQHRHMGQMFTRLNWWRRDIGLATQVRHRRALIVSSQTALQDMWRYYPRSRGRGHVVRFAVDLDVGAFLGRGEEMRRIYDLPARFFYLPNQFWRHKNHRVIVEALAQLKTEGVLEDLPPVVLSGLNRDERNPGHFESLQQSVHDAGILQHFRYLGLIPYEHVLCLAASCEALVNPSLFEGWSTPIEEAKAVGAPLMLSDTPIHREQAPHAMFFDPDSAASAAATLLNIARAPAHVRDSVAKLATAQDERLQRHALSLLATLQDAVTPEPKATVAARSN